MINGVADGTRTHDNRNHKPKWKTHWRFDPKPDITAYELARIQLSIMGQTDAIRNARVHSLPADLKRHIKFYSDEEWAQRQPLGETEN